MNLKKVDEKIYNISFDRFDDITIAESTVTVVEDTDTNKRYAVFEGIGQNEDTLVPYEEVINNFDNSIGASLFGYFNTRDTKVLRTYITNALKVNDERTLQKINEVKEETRKEIARLRDQEKSKLATYKGAESNIRCAIIFNQEREHD